VRRLYKSGFAGALRLARPHAARLAPRCAFARTPVKAMKTKLMSKIAKNKFAKDFLY
jgi:hypothetical protein